MIVTQLAETIGCTAITNHMVKTNYFCTYCT